MNISGTTTTEHVSRPDTRQGAGRDQESGQGKKIRDLFLARRGSDAKGNNRKHFGLNFEWIRKKKSKGNIYLLE
jgi:hypothetical protein